jgi:putative SOS response-associated peptidase YedK
MQPYFVLKTRYECREAIPATRGLVNSWAKDASRASMCINAKAETVDKLLSFREAFEKRRCVVPADRLRTSFKNSIAPPRSGHFRGASEDILLRLKNIPRQNGRGICHV